MDEEAAGLVGGSLAESRLHRATTNIKNPPKIQVNVLVLLGGFAPQVGQVSALLLTCPPHSLQVTRAMARSYIVGANLRP